MADLVVLGIGLVLGAACMYAYACLRILRRTVDELAMHHRVDGGALTRIEQRIATQRDHMDSLDRDCARFADKLGMSRDGGAA